MEQDPKTPHPNTNEAQFTDEPQSSTEGRGLGLDTSDAGDADSPTPPRPAFLDPDRADQIGYVDGSYMGGPDTPPDFTTWDEKHEPNPEPTSALKPRHREIARLHALGKTNNQIAEKLGYSASRISILLGYAAIQREVDNYRNKLYERDLATAIKELGHDATTVIETMLKDSNQKLKDRTEAAKWVIEKVTGKPKQALDVESNTLGRFLDIVQQMQASGESLDEIDVTPDQGSKTGGEPPKLATTTKSDFDDLADDLYED